MGEHRRLSALADAVTNGELVDWRGVAARVSSSRGRAYADQLKTLSLIAGSNRWPASTDRLAHSGSSGLLPAVRILAASLALVGAVGMMAGAAIDDGDILRLSIVASFGLTGAMLSWVTRNRAAPALAGAYWSIAASFAIEGTGEIFYALPGRIAAVLDAIRPEAFLGAFFWQFSREFPVVTRFSRVDRLCGIAFSISLTIGAVLFVANLAPALVDSPRLREVMTSLNRLEDGGLGFWAPVFAATLPALIVIPLRSRHAAADERRRVRAFLIGVAVGLGPVTVEVLAESVSAAFAAIMDGPGARTVGAWFIYPPILAMAPITAYAVGIDGVLQLRVAVRQGLRHLLVRWLTVGVASFGVLILAPYLYNRRALPVADVLGTGRGLLFLACTAAGALLLVFRSSLLRALDRWVIPGTDDATAMFEVLARDLQTCRTPQELARAFSGVAGRALQTIAEVYVVANDARLVPLTYPSAATLSDSLVPLLIRSADTPFVVEPGHANSCYNLLTVADRRWIDERRIGVVIRLTGSHREDLPSTVVALQSRRNAQIFSGDDLRFLATAASSVQFAAKALQRDVGPAERDGDELAVQCQSCRRVDMWRAGVGVCECGGQWESAALPLEVFGRFRLDALLGAGGMGVVYRATDSVLHRAVAIKTLPKLTRGAADRLIVEARAMASMSHPNIGILYGTETWRDTPVLIMEYLSGGTLESRLQRSPLDAGHALRLIVELAGALEHVHRVGHYHGDIKPSNVGFNEHGVPKFLDFGLSRAFVHAAAPLAGTLPYLSPEALRGEPAGPLMDVWALCVVLFEALSGVHPFLDGQRTARRIAAGLNRSRLRLPRHLRQELWDFFDSALASDSMSRPGSARELRQAVVALEQQIT
jgi:hypothetical protein